MASKLYNIPNSPRFCVRDAKGPFNSNSFVSDFITVGRWNVSKLRNYMFDEAILDIKFVPLSLTDLNDRLVWHYNTKGNNMVKSGYHIALKLREDGLHQFDCSSHQASAFLVPGNRFGISFGRFLHSLN